MQPLDESVHSDNEILPTQLKKPDNPMKERPIELSDDSVHSDNEISPTQMKKTDNSMKEWPIELLDKDVITCEVESNGEGGFVIHFCLKSQTALILILVKYQQDTSLWRIQ